MFHRIGLMFMERDNVTPCYVRILTFVGVFGYMGLTWYNITHGHPVDPMSWGAGFTALVLGGAGATRVKLETENQGQ